MHYNLLDVKLAGENLVFLQSYLYVHGSRAGVSVCNLLLSISIFQSVNC